MGRSVSAVNGTDSNEDPMSNVDIQHPSLRDPEVVSPSCDALLAPHTIICHPITCHFSLSHRESPRSQPICGSMFWHACGNTLIAVRAHPHPDHISETICTTLNRPRDNAAQMTWTALDLSTAKQRSTLSRRTYASSLNGSMAYRLGLGSLGNRRTKGRGTTDQTLHVSTYHNNVWQGCAHVLTRLREMHAIDRYAEKGHDC